jgi:uncharacterized integral membrane protein (TIGR00697 family)
VSAYRDPTVAPGGDAGQEWLRAIVALFVAVLITSNFTAAKLITVAGFVVPAAVVLFPISYIIGDVLTEVYGYGAARKAIWLGFACNLVVVGVTWLSISLPPASAWTLPSLESVEASQRAYAAVLGMAPRIVLGSLLAYLAGEFLNAAVLARLKVATGGRFLWVRTIGSTLVGQLADSAIFISIAFAGLVPGRVLGLMLVAQWLVKSGFEAVATPVTYLVVGRLKAIVGGDRFDRGVSLNPIRWG